jgi:hypothetical protein
MSWDVVILNLGGARPQSVEEIAETPTKSLGSNKRVRERISTSLPETEWQSSDSGFYSDGEDLSLEFSIDGTSKVEAVIVHARGSGDAIGALLRLASANEWSLLDTSTSEMIDPDNPSSEGWEGFQDLVRRGASRTQKKKRRGK